MNFLKNKLKNNNHFRPKNLLQIYFKMKKLHLKIINQAIIRIKKICKQTMKITIKLKQKIILTIIIMKVQSKI